MPYFVFKINNHREYHCLESFDSYREARTSVRARRQDHCEHGVVEYRMVFADSESQGQALLRQRRERTPSEDD